eukprot:TRINITY_DN88593_c1_g1_i1.p1 TRINITY_DN88593_c1_g1~~TRINITY_DN88593_c1_g1_i1.p1  ORF type:complete len:543 (-),score=83.94 TRINITY_DN88593_c1_g1_i1:82-1710(-)
MLEPIAQQYCFTVDKEAHVWWHTDPERKTEDPVEVNIKEPIQCDDFAWSPKGTYLVAKDADGLTLYGGPEMVKLKEFKHKMIAGYKISPNEEYLYLYDYHTDTENLNTLHVYNINTEKELRDFSGLKEETKESIGWSHDGKYLAKMTKDMLSIYETPEMHMLMDAAGKRSSIKAENIHRFAWNKTNNLVAIFRKSANIDTQPAIFNLLDIPSRDSVYLKSVQRVKSCKMHWHPNGRMLALVMTFKTPGDSLIKKSAIGILSIEKRRTEYVEIDVTEVAVFKWEPTEDNHFAILRYEKDPLVDKKETVLEIYYLTTGPLKINKIPEGTHTFPLSHIHWSPLGKFMIATRLIDPKRYLSGAIYGMQYFFYVKGHQAHSINTESHDNARGAGWDPSGRYYASFCTSEVRLENDAYKIYNCFGETMFTEAVPKLTNWKWRRRPVAELPAETVERIYKELPEYTKRYKQLDKQTQEQMAAHIRAEKQAKLNKFMKKYLGPKLEKYEAQRKDREKILGHPEFVEDEYIVKEYYEETLVDEKLEPVAQM